MAYLYFKEQKVDIVVLETGIGGRLDATNIINPLVSVITSVGFDHCEILGTSINQIAFEKSGIIKPGKPLVLGRELPLNYLLKSAKDKNSKVYIADEGNNFQDLHKNLLKKIMYVLSTEYNMTIPKTAIDYAATCEQKCRMEYVDKEMIKRALDSKDPCYVILDAGHNKSALVFAFY